MVGGGAADEFGDPMDLAEFFAREFEQAHDMRREALAELAQVEALTAVAQGLEEPDASKVADDARALLAQARSKITIAAAVRERIVAKMAAAIGGAEWREQGVEARSDERRKQGDVSRRHIDEAARAAQAAGLEVTVDSVTAHWPCEPCPSDRYIHTLLKAWHTRQQFNAAARDAQGAGLRVTLRSIQAHWPGENCPSDKDIHTLIRQWRTEQSK